VERCQQEAGWARRTPAWPATSLPGSRPRRRRRRPRSPGRWWRPPSRTAGSGPGTCCGQRASSPVTGSGSGWSRCRRCCCTRQSSSGSPRTGRGLSGPARRTLRTNLRFLARAVVPQLAPADAPLPRERARAAYTAAEISGYLALADAQPTAARQTRAAGLICLGAGAGLIRPGLRAVRGTDIACRSGGVIVTAGGRRPRVVPVLARYHQPLLASAAFAGTGLVTGGTDTDRGNITNPLVSALAGGTGLPRPDTSRLRATWQSERLRYFAGRNATWI
jgi:hypothetical protein